MMLLFLVAFVVCVCVRASGNPKGFLRDDIDDDEILFDKPHMLEKLHFIHKKAYI